MKFFSWLTAIILIVVCGILGTFISGYISSYFGLYSGLKYGMIITGMFPLVIIIYFMAWLLMWNKGKAESPFKLILEFLS